MFWRRDERVIVIKVEQSVPQVYSRIYYYFVGILPLLALLIVGRKTTILYEILNIVVLWMPRFLTPWITLFLIPATTFIRKDYSEDPIDIPDNIPDDDYLLSE